jgi:ArsR family transcriptional regulator
MDRIIQERFEARAKILKAMAHPTRLIIIEALARQEECVNALTELVGADTSTVSRHLLLLKNAGIIADEKRGKQVFYRLQCTCIPDFLRCIERVLQEQVASQSRLLTPSCNCAEKVRNGESREQQPELNTPRQ